MGWNSPNEYSGGRYHAWMMAEALSAGGHHVTYVTNARPVFMSDFRSYPDHRRIKICLTRDFRTGLPLRDFDIVILVPHLNVDPSFFMRIKAFAVSRKARLATLNFETPNWYNALSPSPRSPHVYTGWKRMCGYADMIISSAEESVRYAREYFDDIGPETIHTACYPSINSRVADTVTGVKPENRVLLFGRFFAQDAHKGSTQANKLFCEALRGYTMVFIVGSKQATPPEFDRWQVEADAFGIRLEIKTKLSDVEKFREIKRSKLVLFPSFFEGFGYPPVEAQYCNVPCIAFDLPVVRETSGDGAYYVPIGDWDAFQAKIGEVLRSGRDHTRLKEHIAPIATFDSYVARMDTIVETLMQRSRAAGRNHRSARAAVSRAQT